MGEEGSPMGNWSAWIPTCSLGAALLNPPGWRPALRSLAPTLLENTMKHSNPLPYPVLPGGPSSAAKHHKDWSFTKVLPGMVEIIEF